jgi:molybdenum cofactor cytidylyltransferase
MPVEPGNLMLLGNIKTNNKNIDLVGMPGCARSPKENGVDWILWRLFSELGISKKEINNMGNGGLL